MSGEIDIPIAGNANKFVRATEDVEEALKAVSDSLDEMSEGTRKGAEDSERAVEKLAESFDDVRKAARDAGDAGTDAGREIDRGMDRAKEGTDDFKREANSTAKESAASFDGSAESIVDSFQEIAANAFEGFGPAGAVAGLAAAAGIGLVVKGFQDAEEARKQSEEAIAEWAEKFIETGQAVATESQKVAGFQAILTDPEKFKKAQEAAEAWGVSVGTAVAAMAGDEAALHAVNDALLKLEESLPGVTEGMRTNASAAREGVSAAQGQNEELKKARGLYDSLTGAMASGAERMKLNSQYLLDLATRTEGATEQIDKFGNRLVSLPDGKQILIDAKTGQATEDVEQFKGDVEKIKSKEITVTAKTKLDLQGAQATLNAFSPTVTVTTSFVDRYGKPIR